MEKAYVSIRLRGTTKTAGLDGKRSRDFPQTVYAIEVSYGTWEHALRAIGLSTRVPKTLTEDIVVKSIDDREPDSHIKYVAVIPVKSNRTSTAVRIDLV